MTAQRPPSRRNVLAGAGALAAASLAAPAVHAVERARRTFRILRDGDDIGTHTLEARLSEPGFEIHIDVDIAVTFLGFTAYTYTLKNHEVWSGGRLLEIDSEVDDDGTEEFARIRRGDGELRIEGSGYEGAAPLESVTTSYYAKPFLERRPWISTQSGEPLEIDIRMTASQPAAWAVTGELTTRLFYDDAGEWVGCEFDAGGKDARYEVVESTGPIGEMWSRA